MRHGIQHISSLGAMLAMSSLPMMASVRSDENTNIVNVDEGARDNPAISRQVRRQMERQARKGGVK